MVGAKKAQIGRLTSVMGDKIAIWGIPQIWCTPVRSSDIARTPDIRSLPILRQWCCTIVVQFVGSLIKPASIANLLGAAGLIVGIGDGRPEKGKFSFGQFRVCAENDPEYRAILKQGRALQDKALADPVPYDRETEELLRWFVEEKTRRIAQPAPQPRSARKGNGPETRRVETRLDVI